MNTSPSSDFWRICIDQELCHCDYRMTLEDCVEHDVYLYINYVSLTWSALCCVLILGIVGWRVLYRGQKIMELHGFFPRAKPIESLGLFGGLFNLSRMIHSIILITDVAPWPTFRLFMFDLSWQLGFTAFTCYFFGVSHTLSVSNRVIFKAWVGSTAFFEIFCIATTLIPFIVPTIFNIMSGIYATQGNMALAGKYTSVNYYCWAVFAVVLAILIMFAGIRLVALLNDHLSSQLNRHNNMAKIKTGALKIKITMLAGCATLLCLAVIACIYAAARTSITLYSPYSYTLAIIVNFIGPATSTIICLAVLLNPAIVSTLGFWSFGSVSESQSLPPPFESDIPINTPIDGQFYTSFQDLKSKLEEHKSDDHRMKCNASLQHSYDMSYAKDHTMPLEYTRRLSFYQQGSYSDSSMATLDRLEKDQLRYNCTTDAIRLQRPISPSKPNNDSNNGINTKEHLPAS